MAGPAQLIRFADIPAKGNPAGLIQLVPLVPTGDRGFTFGRSKHDGIPVGKIPGYWTCPYNATITAVILNTDRGSYSIMVWKNSDLQVPTVADRITTGTFAITAPNTHSVILDLANFSSLEVAAGDTFAVEIVKVVAPIPTDIAGEIVMLKQELEGNGN